MKVVALAGGVGGAKLADGLAGILPPDDLTIVVNTGDDFEHLGLKICPDLDTVCYTLAGLANQETGWGRSNETWNTFAAISQLGGPDWFRLGDLDLGTHLERTRRLLNGQTLSNITKDFCRIWRIGPRILPMSDDPVPTIILSDEGELPFQEYFVKRRCVPKVQGFRFHRSEKAKPAPGLIEAIQNSNLIVFCPSNPWVSIDPILGVPTLRDELQKKLVIAVSPIIGGQAVKGPAAKMYSEMGISPSALAVAKHYQNIISGFVLDIKDECFKKHIEFLNIKSLMTDTLMLTTQDRKKLASQVIEFGERLLSKNG